MVRDYISRAAALTVLDWDCASQDALNAIKAIPAADVVDRQALLDKVTEVGIRKWNGSHFTTQIIRVIPEEALLAAQAVIPKEADK